MLRFSLRDLTPQLFAIVIVPLTLLLQVIIFEGLYLHRQAMRNLVEERDEGAARAAASAHGFTLRKAATSTGCSPLKNWPCIASCRRR